MIQIESPSKPGGRSPALWASTRPDLWPSQSEAEKHIRSSPFWRRWDSRAVAKYIEHGLRPVPTALYPLDPQSSNGEMSSAKVTPNSVTLTTTKAQEAWTYLRFNITPYEGTTKEDMSSDSAERFLSPDLATSAKEGTNNHPSFVTTCPWTSLAFEFLPYIRPSVLFAWGEKSHINTPGARRDDKLLRVGTGLGGSGGVRAGMVRDEVVKGASHTVSLEEVGETARVVSDWLVGWWSRRRGIWRRRSFGRSMIARSRRGVGWRCRRNGWSISSWRLIQNGRQKGVVCRYLVVLLLGVCHVEDICCSIILFGAKRLRSISVGVIC